MDAQVCYVAFWDDVTLATQEAEGHKIGENGYIGKWRVVVVKDLPFTDQRLNGKIPKVPFVCFTGACCSLYCISCFIHWMLTCAAFVFVFPISHFCL